MICVASVLLLWWLMPGLPSASGLANSSTPVPVENYRLPVGEKLTYALMWDNLHAGVAILSVQDQVTVNGVSTYHLRMKVDTGDILNAIYAVHDKMDSFVDAVNGSSLRFVRSIREGTWKIYKADEQIDFDYQEKLARRKATQYQHGLSVGQKVKRPYPVPGPLHDPLSFLYYFRNNPLKPDTPHSIILGGRKECATHMISLGQSERLNIPGLGIFDACKIVFESKDLTGKHKGLNLFLAEGDLDLWIDRKTGIPLKLRLQGLPILGSAEVILRGAETSPLQIMTGLSVAR